MAVLEKRSDDVSINGQVCEVGFNIMASAEAFEILSDRIYPNKIKAVVRELSTNAVDATIDARKVSKIHQWIKEEALISHIADALHENSDYVNKEVEAFTSIPNYDLSNWVEQAPLVHLPNSIEPWFSIRDYGTGLSHDFIMKLYTTYFWSDKKTSNDYTGCLGLGSKSPFAYTDHFTVTSYWNGEKRMYNAHLKNGFPSISIFLDDDGKEMVFPTEEPNGIEVQFAVKNSDFTEFGNEARRLYPYFKMPMKVVGNSSVSQYIDKINTKKAAGEYYKLGNNKTIEWGFRKESDYSDRGPKAIMGNIAYPISLQNKYNYSNIVQRLLDSSIDIVFPVGSLQITPSREQLSYKESTVKAIEVALEQIAEELAEKINDKIQSATSLWDARCLASEVFHTGDFQGFVSILSLGKLKWQGQEIGSSLHIQLKPDEGYTVYKFGEGGRTKRKEVTTFPLQRNALIYEIDLPKGSFTRLEILHGQKGNGVYGIEFSSKTARDKFIERLGMPANTTFPGTSSLPKPTVNQRASYSNDSKIFKYSQSHTRYAKRTHYSYWSKVDSTFQLSDGGVYVEMMRYKMKDKDGVELHPHHVTSLLNKLEDIKEIKPDVIGVRKQMVKQFVRSDDWVDFPTYCTNIMKVHNTKFSVGVHIANINEMNATNHFSEFEELIPYINQLEDGVLKDFLKKVEVMVASRTALPAESGDYQNFADYIGFKFNDPPTHKISQDVDNVLNTYPMLRYVLSSGVSDANMADVVKYLNGLDKTCSQ